MELELTLAALCAFAFLAGFIDAAAGGGGLIQVPALFVLMPGVSPATLLGTNKFASVWGTLSATIQYSRHVKLDWRATLPTCLTALVFGYIGAQLVATVDPMLFKPLVLILLIAVLAYTLWKKNLGALHAPKLSGTTQVLAALATGTVLGFYDGFFGPGTGSFLVFAFVGLFGFSFLAASASAKLVNLITNLAALAYFAAHGHVLYATAIPMAVCNVLGSQLGARLAIKNGSGFVRAIFVVVVGALILRYAYDLSGPF